MNTNTKEVVNDMICHNCGKELPDGTQFCGYCGAAQIQEPKEEPIPVREAEEIQLVLPSEEEVQEVPSEVEEAEIVEETPEETPVPEVPAPEVIPEVQPEEIPAEQPVKKERKKIDIKVNKEDYLPILSVLKNPFEQQRLSWPAIGVLLLVILLINWLVFREMGGFGTALAVTFVLYFGAFLILFINGSKPFKLKNLCGMSAAVMTVPALVMLIGGIISLFQASSTIAFAVAATLMILAMILYILILESHADHLNKYLLAVLLAILFGLIVLLQSNAFAAIIAKLSFPG